MSVMSVGKKPKAPVRPLGAGNSRAGGPGGEVRTEGPGAAASRSEKRNVPGVSVAAQPGVTGPARPRAAARKPSARPRLWVVPDAADPTIAGPDVAMPDVAGPDVAGPDCRAGPAGCCRAGRDRALPGQAEGRGAEAAGGSRRADPGPAAQPQAGWGALADTCGPARIGALPGACRSSGCGGPGSPGAGAGWSGLSPFSSSSRSSPRSCSLWRPGRRQLITACRRLRCGPPCGMSWSSQASRCGRSR